jgi:hypothetical protein
VKTESILKGTLRTGLAIIALSSVAQARAGFVNYQIVNPAGGANVGTSGYSDLNTETVTMDGGAATSVFAGGIMISQNPGNNNSSLPSSYTTVCTDISGTVYLGQTYTYNAPTPFSASQGVDPTWGAVNTPTYLAGHSVDGANAAQAIQNAAYIFYTFGALLSSGLTGSATHMADVQLAVWEALYDTGANGQVTVSGGRFTTSDTTAQGIINGWLAQLNSSGKAGNFGYLGYLLFPTQGGGVNADGQPPQELLLGSNVVTPVPEPSTLIAGAFVLVPFGISTLRFRRNKAA